MQCPTTTGWSQAIAPLTANHPACGAGSSPSGQALAGGQKCLAMRPPASCIGHSGPVHPCAQPAKATGSLPAHERLFQARHCVLAKLARHMLRPRKEFCWHSSVLRACAQCAAVWAARRAERQAAAARLHLQAGAAALGYAQRLPATYLDR